MTTYISVSPRIPEDEPLNVVTADQTAFGTFSPSLNGDGRRVRVGVTVGAGGGREGREVRPWRRMVKASGVLLIGIFAAVTWAVAVVSTAGVKPGQKQPTVYAGSGTGPPPFPGTKHPLQPTALWGEAYASRAYPTGAWFTNLVLGKGDGAVAPLPYVIRALDSGLEVSYSAFRRVIGTSPSSITDAFAADVIMG